MEESLFRRAVHNSWIFSKQKPVEGKVLHQGSFNLMLPCQFGQGFDWMSILMICKKIGGLHLSNSCWAICLCCGFSEICFYGNNLLSCISCLMVCKIFFAQNSSIFWRSLSEGRKQISRQLQSIMLYKKKSKVQVQFRIAL